MQRKHQLTWRRMAVVGVIGATALIGEMRASGAPGIRAAGAGASGPAHAPRMRMAVAPVPAGRAARPHGAAAPDDVQLVPAIYAWDPDVRFIYYRHVSKWM